MELGGVEAFEVDEDAMRDLGPAIRRNSMPSSKTRSEWPYFLAGEADGSAEHLFAIDDLIHEATVAMVYGKQGSLKTPLIMDMGAHVALGIPYQGLRTNKGCMLYVAAEGVGAIGKRVAGINAEHPSLPDDWFVGITRAVNLMQPEDAADFAEFVVHTILPKLSMPVRFVVYDTMAKSAPGVSDSSDDTISALESNARLVAAAIGNSNADGFIPATVFAHHPKKNDPGYRGSGSIEGNFDTLIHITKTDAPELEDRLYEVSTEKVKDGPDERSWAYRAARVHVGTTPSGKENYAPVVRYLDDEQRIRAVSETKVRRKKLKGNLGHMIDLMTRIETRDGRSIVPSEVLSKSGYLAAASEAGLKLDVPVNGMLVKALQDQVYSEDEDVRTGTDGKRTVPEVARGRWRRKLDSLINSTEAWVCDEWVWFAGDVKRPVADGATTLDGRKSQLDDDPDGRGRFSKRPVPSVRPRAVDS